MKIWKDREGRRREESGHAKAETRHALDPALVCAIERVLSASDDHPHAAQQPGFGTYCAIAYYTMRDGLLEHVPAAAKLPFDVVDRALSILTVDALRLGAKAYAALARDAEQPTSSTEARIGFSKLWVAYQEVAADGTELAAAWSAALNQLGDLQDVLDEAAADLTVGIMTLHPAFAAQDRAIVNMVLELLYRGAAAEFCLTRLLSDEAEEGSVLPKIVAAVTGSGDLNDPANVAAFVSAVGVPDTVLPWPIDEQCICGKGLGPAIFCCDPAKPFSMGDRTAELIPGFVLVRPCCDQHFEGFRCDACGRVYSWSKGTVDTLRGQRGN